MRKPWSPNCLWSSTYISWNLDFFVFEAYLLCISADVSPLPLLSFPKNCYKNDVAIPNVRYGQRAEPMSGAHRDLPSLPLSDLEVVLFSCCHLKSALWDAEHPWQALSTWAEAVLCRISPLTESFSWKTPPITVCTRVWAWPGNFLCLSTQAMERSSSVTISKRFVFFWTQLDWDELCGSFVRQRKTF